jgi:3',5'-cyclic AMP phosphodiesterase CpdA
MMEMESVCFVHVSDTHFGPTVEYGRDQFTPYPCNVKLVEIINSLPVRPDFVVHTGDVATDPDEAAYALAREVFGKLNVPCYYVTGNHDSSRMVRKHLPMGPLMWLVDDSDVVCYRFEVKGYRFLVLDGVPEAASGRAPDHLDPHGLLSDEQLEIVRQEAAASGPPLTVFVHFPVWPLNSPWMDANMLILNGDKLHEALLPARKRLRGVFHGHVHQSMQTTRDGIVHTAVPSTYSQFSAWPTDLRATLDPVYPPAFNFVTLLPEQTIVHQHLFVRP